MPNNFSEGRIRVRKIFKICAQEKFETDSKKFENNSKKSFEEKNLVKRIRAMGECLGTRSRRRTQKAAKSRGETHTVYEPRVSEWGNPAERTSVILCPIHKHRRGDVVN